MSAGVPIDEENAQACLDGWAFSLFSREASGADVVGVVREAVLRRMRENDDQHGMLLATSDVMEAIDYLL